MRTFKVTYKLPNGKITTRDLGHDKRYLLKEFETQLRKNKCKVIEVRFA